MTIYCNIDNKILVKKSQKYEYWPTVIIIKF